MIATKHNSKSEKLYTWEEVKENEGIYISKDSVAKFISMDGVVLYCGVGVQVAAEGVWGGRSFTQINDTITVTFQGSVDSSNYN